MNKKLIMGLAVCLCVVAVVVLVVAIAMHSHDDEIIIEDTPGQVDKIDESNKLDKDNVPNNDLQVDDSKTDNLQDSEVETDVDGSNEQDISTDNIIEDDFDESEYLYQYEEWLPALTDEQLEMLGDNDVLHDKKWLNNMHKILNSYTMRYNPGDMTSISIYYLEDARVAYFVFTTDKTDYAFMSSTYIYSSSSILTEYMPTLSKVDLDLMTSRGFYLLYTIDENNHKEIIDFFNDWSGHVYSDNDYQNLFELTINDLL